MIRSTNRRSLELVAGARLEVELDRDLGVGKEREKGGVGLKLGG